MYISWSTVLCLCYCCMNSDSRSSLLNCLETRLILISVFFSPLLLLCHVHKKKNPSQLNHICWDLLNLCALLLWLHSDNWTCWNGSSNLQSGVLMNCVLCLLLSGSYSHRCDKGGLWFSTCGPSVQSLWNIGIVLAAVATVLFNYGHVQNIIPRTGLIQDALARELVINYLYSTIK